MTVIVRSMALIGLSVAAWVVAMLIAAWVLPSRAEPPEGADASLAPFYRSLKVPGSEASCCDVADCRPVVVRWHGGKLWAFIGGQFHDPPNTWVEVPEAVMIRGVANQQGEPVLCFYMGRVRCFLDGGQS